MQRVRRWYSPVVTTLTFLIVAAMGCVLLIAWLGGSPRAPFDASQMVDIELFSPMEEIVATGVGPDPATVTLRSGIWVIELDINTENYDGITLHSVQSGRSATTYWTGERRVIVISDVDRVGGLLYPGETRVRTGALPGYKWTVTFTRHDVR